MYIVLINQHVIGLYTSHVDAAAAAEKHPYRIIYHCPPNTSNVTIWDKPQCGKLFN